MPNMAVDGPMVPSGGGFAQPERFNRVGEQLSRAGDQTLRILILVYCNADARFADLSRALALATDEGRIVNLRLEIKKCDLSSDAEFAERVAQWARTEQALLIISDRFSRCAPGANMGASELAQLLRECTSDGKAITALLALVDPPVGRISLVDNVVERDADSGTLVQAVERTLGAIRYKYPPAKRLPRNAESLEARVVGDVAELRACLALRYDVYKQLGYFYEDPEREAIGLELDYYDPSSLHFVAVAPGETPRIAGTARLIFAASKSRRGKLFGDTTRIRADSERMCQSISAAASQLRKKLERGPGPAALPLLAAFDYGELASDGDASVAVGHFCEISRVVVADDFRGYGASRLLVRACIAAAVELGLRYVVLECIPQHTSLYEKFGFTKITDASHRRAWGIDQLATIMRLRLSDDPTNVAVQMAKRDIAMMQTARSGVKAPDSLCLCRNSRCWEHGRYASKGLPTCPLKARFVE